MNRCVFDVLNPCLSVYQSLSPKLMSILGIRDDEYLVARLREVGLVRLRVYLCLRGKV